MQATPAAQAVQEAHEFKCRAGSTANNDNADPFLDHYFRRIDPRTAVSFDETQRAAIKQMFSHRDIAVHALEVRRTFTFARKSFYLVFLFGRERRAYERLGRSGESIQPFNLAFYLVTAAAWLAPGFILARLFG